MDSYCTLGCKKLFLTFNKHFQLQRQFVTELDEYKIKARTEHWQFYYTGEIREKEKNEQKTDTHKVGVWRNNTPLNCWVFFRIKAGYFSGYQRKIGPYLYLFFAAASLSLLLRQQARTLFYDLRNSFRQCRSGNVYVCCGSSVFVAVLYMCES